MILKQETFQDTVVGADVEMGFEIDTESSLIFEILRNKMYKDKIGSICREVASNSRDANRETGTDKPVEIEVLSPHKLLSMGHLSISFKDYGKGISPNKMADVYVKYGASDKRASDTLTGGFGLGAKTPFAYNDTFTVITICDYEGKRMKYTYTAMIDSSQKGKMVLFDKKETTEDTGTQVIVPINTEDDRYKFERESLKYTKTWGDNIVYKNFTYSQEELENVYEDENFALYKLENYRYGSKVELLIDGIPYPLDTNMVNVNDTIGRHNSFYLTVMKFDTGQLTISANRESVQYDDETVKLIGEKQEEIQETLDLLLENHIEEQESYKDACVLTYYVNRKSSNQANPPALTGALIAHSKSTGFKFKDVTWKGRKTVDEFLFKKHTIYEVKTENGRNKYVPTKIFHFSKSNIGMPIYYGDVRKNSRRNENIWEDGHKRFLLIKPNNLEDKEGIQEFMDFTFNFDLDFKIYSELEVKKDAITGTYAKKSYVTLNVRKLGRRFLHKETVSLDRKTFESEFEEIDFDNAVYMTVDRLSDADNVPLDSLRLLARSKEKFSCYVIREKDYENWFKHTGIKNYKDVIEKYEKEVIEKNKEKVLNHLIYKKATDYVSSVYIDVVKEILPKCCKNMEELTNSNNVSLVKKHLKFDFDGLEKKLKRIFVEQYPMITHCAGGYSWSSKEREQKREQIKLYIKQVNKYYGS